MMFEYRKPSIWTLVIGILLIIIGIYAWMNMGVALAALALYVGIIFLVIGVGYLLAFFSGQASGWYLTLGLLDIFVGVIFVSNLPEAMLAMPYIFAFWCLFTGIIQVVAAINMKNGLGKKVWGWPLVSGILALIFAFLIFFDPLAGAVAIAILIGAYLFINGLFMVIEYFSGKSLKKA